MTTSPDQVAHEILEVIPLVMRTIRKEMRRYRRADLSVPQFRTLAFVNRNPGASLSEVAEHIGLTLPSMSKLVDGLVARRLLARKLHTVDRRRIVLGITARGSITLRATLESTKTVLASHVAALTVAERNEILRALRILYPLFIAEREVESEKILNSNGHSRN